MPRKIALPDLRLIESLKSLEKGKAERKITLDPEIEYFFEPSNWGKPQKNRPFCQALMYNLERH